jgi:hypothetical protein
MSFSNIQEIASHLFGDAVWTHELGTGPTMDAVREEGYRQFPDLPTPVEAANDYAAAARKAVAAYGETLTVAEGTHGRRESPVTTLRNMIGPDKIIVVARGSDDEN